MPASLDHIHPGTPMGANLIADGASFRVWAPQAVNGLLDAKGLRRYRTEDLRGEMNQLRALVDLCHLHGLAVILDVVYNHAGGEFGDQSLYFFDRQSHAGGQWNSLYFADKGHAGGLVFNFAKPEVRDFLIQNAKCRLRLSTRARRVPPVHGEPWRASWSGHS